MGEQTRASPIQRTIFRCVHEDCSFAESCRCWYSIQQKTIWMTTLTNIGGWTCASRISCAIVQRIVNSLVRKICPASPSIYFGFWGYLTMAKQWDSSNFPVSSTCIDSTWKLNNTTHLISVLPLYFDEKYRRNNWPWDPRVHCTNCARNTFHISGFVSNFNSDLLENFRAQTFALIPRPLCKSFETQLRGFEI